MILEILKLNRNVLSYAILKQSKIILDTEEEKQNFLATKVVLAFSNRMPVFTIPNPKSDWKNILQASLESLNFNQELIVDIFKIISAILKLGNLSFISVTNIDGTEGCSISNEPGKICYRTT